MWTWTCSACGGTFTGGTAEEAEAKFFTHAQKAHNPKTIMSINSEEGDDMETCTFCEQEVDSTTTGSDGITKACADCMGEAEVLGDDG